jgi:hypothetical protein
MSADQNRSSSRSIWTCLGIGCLVLIVVTVVVVVGGGYLVYRNAKQFADEMQDPEARSERTLKALGAGSLPEGYHAIGSFKIPFIFEMAIISDEMPEDMQEQEAGAAEPTPTGDEDPAKMFIYIEVMSIGDKQQELRDFFEGKRKSTDMMENVDVDFERGDVIDRGSVEDPEQPFLWVASRGDVTMEGHQGAYPAIITMTLIECTADDRMRMGIWFVPDPQSGVALAEADYAGTAADGAVIDDFLGHFSLCE